MAAIDTVRNLMHGRRMCSVCEIAKATGLDTEVIKPLMVELASEQIYTGTLKPGSYTSAEKRLLQRCGSASQSCMAHGGTPCGSCAIWSAITPQKKKTARQMPERSQNKYSHPHCIMGERICQW